MLGLAQQLFEREHDMAIAEGVIETTDLVVVFAVATAMVAVSMKACSDELASEVAATGVRTLLNNLMFHGVDLPDLRPPR
jgi:hypothetical protein